MFIKPQKWFWFASVAALAIGCSGRVSKTNTGSAPTTPAGGCASDGSDPDARGGNSSRSICPNDADAGFGGEGGLRSAGEAGTESAGEACVAGECLSTRAHVANAWDFECPQELCDARVMASNCDALPGGALKTSALDCWDDHVLLFEISPTRRKACYYGSKTPDGPSFLVGATVWNDDANFCDGRAVRLTGGHARDIDSCGDRPFVTALCDVAHSENNQPIDGSPPRACYNRFSHSCEVCCPETPPDCSNKPDNYPGYECTADTPDDESYCSCRCAAGQWDCEC